jgi:hypothetical protein
MRIKKKELEPTFTVFFYDFADTIWNQSGFRVDFYNIFEGGRKIQESIYWFNKLSYNNFEEIMQKLSELLKDYDDKDYRIDILRYAPQTTTLTIDGEELVLVALKHYSIGRKGKCQVWTNC